ncbi:MAG: efflux RND transporter periplasmic adaptor subunit [Candidatus Acidiferrales bacterium]
MNHARRIRGAALGLAALMPLIWANGCGRSSVTQSAGAAANSSAPTSSSSPMAPAGPIAQHPATEQGETGMLSVLSVEHEVDVLAKLSGVVVQAPLEESQQVRAGEELARLDDRQLVAQLDKARADLTVAEDNVKYNEAELKAKQANLRRTQQLRQLGLGSEADLDNADFLEKGAEYDLKAWEATVVGNQATVRELQAELDQTRIRAPFSGVIAHRYIREGQSVLKDEKCFRISQLIPLQVQFQVPETSGRKPRIGDTVHLATMDDAGRTLQARIVKMSPIIDPASDSYDVTARLTGANISDLRPGMAVRVEWPGATAVAAAPKK